MNNRLCSLVVFQLALVIAGSADCSTSKQFRIIQSQTISGKFVDQNQAPLSGISIELVSGKAVVKSLRTSSDGTYDFGLVSAGKYRLKVPYGSRVFCAPIIRCKDKKCTIDPVLKTNPAKEVTVE